MADYSILYWQDLPSVVEAGGRADKQKIQLSQKFQDLIDLVAMKKGLAGTDAYLDEWSRGKPEQRDGTPEEVAKAVADEFEARFEEIKNSALEGLV